MASLDGDSRENVDVSLSDYAKKLDLRVKARYIEKIAVVGIDPLLVPENNFDPECLPPIEAVDLVTYLVLETSYYTKNQFKAFKSLEAYNQMVSGFITGIQGKKFGSKFVVMGKVRHSQRMNERPVQAWIISEDDGTILSAHCIGCMAGLGECCSHVASILFYIEVWTRVQGKLACTQVKCSWILPTFAKEINYARIQDINFKSAKKLKEDLDKCIKGFGNEVIKADRNVSKIGKDEVVLAPSKEDIECLYEELSKCKIKPVILSLHKPYAKAFVAESRDIPTIPDLYDERYLKLQYNELLNACSNEINVTITDEEARKIEKDTQSQAKCNSFFQHRAGRIGASMSKAAAHSNPAQPSQHLIKSICYPKIFMFTSAATAHGCKHEDSAVEAFENEMIKKHNNYKISKCGMFINKEHPWLHATPDFMSFCDCCGNGCGEVKCPYCMERADFDDYVTKKSSCLEKVGGEMVLKRNHQYYYQTQQQLFTTKTAFCDFVVCGFTDSETAFVHERILPDEQHWDNVLPKINHFWRYCVLPEIVGRWYTRKCELLKPTMNAENSPCFCKTNTSEATVKCLNDDCPILSYHLSCLKITQLPKRWFCPHCQKLPKVKKKNVLKAANKMQAEEFLALKRVCKCQQRPKETDMLIKCHNEFCKNGKFFHVSCLGYKRKPNNHNTTWRCDICKINPSKTNLQATTNDVHHMDKFSGIDFDEEILDQVNFTSTNEVEITKITEGKTEKFGPLSSLTKRDFELIESDKGCLDCDIIHHAQCILKKVSPMIDGFQRPTLGPVRNFDIVTGEFVQILHTGHFHWICVSSIGCQQGTVNLYDSLYRNIIDIEIEEQVKCLVGDNIFKGINVVPVQQQENGSDCGIFAIAFATSLAYYTPPETVQFDMLAMRGHLSSCLKLGFLEHFPTL